MKYKNLKNIVTGEEFKLILCKLLYDAVFLLLFSFICMIVTEGILPGIITSHISLSKVAIFIIVILWAIIWLNANLKISFKSKIKQFNFYTPLLVTLSFLLIGNALLKFALWENMVITLVTLSIMLLFYKQLFHTE